MTNLTLVGVDTGGTFTDIVVLDNNSEIARLRQCKVLSNPEDLAGPAPERNRPLVPAARFPVRRVDRRRGEIPPVRDVVVDEVLPGEEVDGLISTSPDRPDVAEQ